MDFEKNIKIIEKKIGYTFKDKGLLQQAFTRTSYCNEHKAKGYRSNEVLEFFGDSILSASIITLFLREFSERYEHGVKTTFEEGDFTIIRSKLSDKKNLSDRIRETGIQQYLLMGDGDTKLGVADEPSVMEDLFESIIGAVYIDTGMDMPAVIRVVAGMLDVRQFMTRESSASAVSARNSKNRLQEWCADRKRRLPPPVYKTIGESGPDHKKIYERACYIGDRMCSVGSGKNQKAADSDAAERALAILMDEEKRKNAPVPDDQAIAKLKAYARSRKLPSPEFRDMGETEASTPSLRQYAVMCSFAGMERTGVAYDKSGARSAAAELVMAEINKENTPKQKPAKKAQKNEDMPPRVNKTKPKYHKRSSRKSGAAK